MAIYYYAAQKMNVQILLKKQKKKSEMESWTR